MDMQDKASNGLDVDLDCWQNVPLMANKDFQNRQSPTGTMSASV